MTAACPQTRFAPNPPQMDEPQIRILLIVLALVILAATAFAGS